jgi:hypothetical protein
MSVVEKLLGFNQYSEYRKIVYYEMWIILDGKKEFIQSSSISEAHKKRRISEICDFLYLEKDMENFNKMDNILKILQIKENIHSN